MGAGRGRPAGYRGKLHEKARARELRAQAWTMPEIAEHLGVSKSSVSLWTRDVPFDPTARRSARTDRRPRGSDHPLRRRKLERIEQLRCEAVDRIGTLDDLALLHAGLGLYAGDGSKTQSSVRFANSDPRMVALFCRWLRRFFEVDEDRLRVTLYLHAGLDLVAAEAHWAEVTGVPVSQFGKPYRAAPDASIRHNKHVHGCAHVAYHSADTHRQGLALMDALLTAPHEPSGAETASGPPARAGGPIEALRGPGSNRRQLD
ncbi:helix-turn-helix domain-containing protein [Nitriliruptor alkaliphilus]|uniref:helix-turn-helix domain-containing protein n=1 Tax=Nitriliruptor alkaliphilus TaxID=427918 RepID=UPI0012EE8F92